MQRFAKLTSRQMSKRVVFITALLCVQGVFGTTVNADVSPRVFGTESADGTRAVSLLCLDLDDAVSGSVKAALLSRLGEVPRTSVTENLDQCTDAEDHLVLTVGNTELATAIIPDTETGALPSEGFIIRFLTVKGRAAIAVRGQGRSDFTSGAHLGTTYGLFSVLEKLGFSFLHPLDPTVPERLAFDPQSIDTRESPHLRIRGIHLHTMHPLELTNLLNGWGKTGPDDAAGFTNMLAEWRSFLTWMLANKLNRVQWVLLASPQWADFVKSDTRLQRLTALVSIAHDFGIETGIDAPIALRQQNAFRLLTRRGSLDEELREICENIDWLMRAGFDYLASENGTTEFTHSDAERMLAWMDGIADHLDTAHRGKRLYMKIHVSSGQHTDAYKDPVTGGPLNINYLTYYADRRTGVMPHTVEFWGLDDPAPTYGNVDFSSIFSYLKAEPGRREVL